jgi:hypothetical protein
VYARVEYVKSLKPDEPKLPKASGSPDLLLGLNLPLVRRQLFFLAFQVEPNQQLLDPRVDRHQADEQSNWNAHGSRDDAEGPVRDRNRYCVEGDPTKEDNQDLPADH